MVLLIAAIAQAVSLRGSTSYFVIPRERATTSSFRGCAVTEGKSTEPPHVTLSAAEGSL